MCFPRRDLPERFGKGKPVHQHSGHRARSGAWARGFQVLGADADNEYATIGAPLVRAHRHSAGARTRGAAARPPGVAGAGCI